MSSAPSYMCAVCRKNFAFEDIRYSNDGKRILCLSCYGQAPKNNKTTKIIISENKKQCDESKFICVNCRYKFSLKKSTKIALVCPYCGKDKIAKDESKSAAELVDEASGNDSI
jgi:hypothetical protein